MRAWHRPIAYLFLGWYLPACTTTGGGWQTHTVVPQAMKQTMYIGDVRVAITDGTVHRFRGVWVSQDSLGGWLVEPAGEERAFAIADVTRVQSRPPRTAANAEVAGRADDSSMKAIAVLAFLGIVGVIVTVVTMCFGGCSLF